jgi:nitrate reductase alpha subunit
MRCQCCNATLSDYESTMRHAITKAFVNTCQTCLNAMGDVIPLQVRHDLASEHDSGTGSLLDSMDAFDGNDCLDDDLADYWDER